MLNPDFTTLTSADLEGRQKFAQIALMAVWCGALLAIGASMYRFGMTGDFPSTLFFMSLVAALVSIPVLQEKNRITAILAEREG